MITHELGFAMEKSCSDSSIAPDWMLAGITSWYLTLFGRLDCKRLETTVEFVIDRMAEVRKFLEEGGDVSHVDPGGKHNIINSLNESMEILGNQD